MIAEIIEAPITSSEQYEQIRQDTATDSDHAPAGAVLHIAGPADSGNWRIVTVWQSRQAAAEWGEKVRAARHKRGIQGDPPKVTYFEVHNLEQARET